MKGRYFLDIIDKILYSTDSYELYNLYNKLFFKEKILERIPIEHPFECKSEANRESFLKAVEQEKKRYSDGYRWVSEWVKIKGNLWKKGRWILQQKEVF